MTPGLQRVQIADLSLLLGPATAAWPKLQRSVQLDRHVPLLHQAHPAREPEALAGDEERVLNGEGAKAGQRSQPRRRGLQGSQELVQQLGVLLGLQGVGRHTALHFIVHPAARRGDR